MFEIIKFEQAKLSCNVMRMHAHAPFTCGVMQLKKLDMWLVVEFGCMHAFVRKQLCAYVCM